MHKIKFDQYAVRGKSREFQVVVFPRKKYMWAYYERRDDRYQIDGGPEAYRLMKFAMAILSVDPGKIIYLPLGRQTVDDESYDAVLCRPELQLRRSEWVHLRRQLDLSHRVKKYVLRYEADKLCGVWERMESSPENYKLWKNEKQEVNELLGDTVFLVLLRESCLSNHQVIVERMRGDLRWSPSTPIGELGWLLSPGTIREIKREAKARELGESLYFTV